MINGIYNTTLKEYTFYSKVICFSCQKCLKKKIQYVTAFILPILIRSSITVRLSKYSFFGIEYPIIEQILTSILVLILLTSQTRYFKIIHKICNIYILKAHIFDKISYRSPSLFHCHEALRVGIECFHVVVPRERSI